MHIDGHILAMDDQIERQKIELKVGEESATSGAVIDSSDELTSADDNRVKIRSANSLSVSMRSEHLPGTRYALRRWPETILTFVMLNTYVALMMQFSMVFASGGIDAWWQLVQFNFLELAGLLFIGSSHLQSVLQQTGHLQEFFVTAIIYWSFFLIYPVFILLDEGKAFGRKKSTRDKCLDVVIALGSLALFIPFPLIAFWRHGGMARTLNLRDSSAYHDRGIELHKTTMANATWVRIDPQVLVSFGRVFFQSGDLFLYINLLYSGSHTHTHV